MSHTPMALSAIACAVVFTLPTAAQSTTRVSVAAGGIEADDVSVGASISADGRFVAFQSSATNLVIADTNDESDVFVRDRLTDSVRRVSVHSFGTEGTAASGAAVISANGRYIAFESLAPNLVAGDTNNRRDVFVHDRTTLSTQRVSISSGGVESDGNSFAPSISADGRFIAFHSRGTNLVANDTNAASDVFLFDRDTNTCTRVSVDSTGLEATGPSDTASISADGRFIAFRSGATDLVANDTNGKLDIFVHDTQFAATTRASLTSGGLEATGNCDRPNLNADGSVVVFESDAIDLVVGDTNLEVDVFRRDLVLGLTTRISVDSSGLESNGPSVYANLDAGGQRVVFHSIADALVAGDTNLTWDVFAHDVSTGTTQRISVDGNGLEGDGASGVASLSSNGRFVVFASTSTNLVAGDLNAANDVFLRDLCDPAVMSYCTAGTTSSGCNATMSGAGIPSASAATSFTINVNNVEGGKSGLVFYGLSGRLELPWGASSSYRCVNIPVQRTPQQSTGGTSGLCDGSLTVDWNAYLSTHPNALGQPFGAGVIVNAQGWFRDPPNPTSTSMSDGLEFCVGL